MNYQDFKAILAKSKKKMMLVGFIILLVGIPFVLAPFLDENKVVYWVFAGIFVGLGLLMILKPMGDLSKIKNDDLPLLQAIKNGNKDFLLWVYQKEITASVDGIKAGKTNNVVIYTRNNKMEELLLGKNGNVAGVISYLSSEFPNALVGYTEENKTQVGSILGKKI